MDTRERNRLARRHLRYGQDSRELENLRKKYTKNEVIEQWDLFWNEETKSWFHSYYDRNGKRDAYDTGVGDPLDPHRAAAQVDTDGVSSGADFLRASGQVGAMLETKVLDRYKNPFASSEEEIGQMDVTIEEEELIRESVRRIILEASDFQCNNHSLGFIDDKGNWIDTEGADHQDYLWANVYNMEDNRPGGYPMPAGWIKVSNANEFWFAARDWNEMTFDQFKGMVDMWSDCKRYSRWLQDDTDNFYVTFGTSDPTSSFGFESMDQYTIPEFIDKYVGRRGEDLFYGMLLGEL